MRRRCLFLMTALVLRFRCAGCGRSDFLKVTPKGPGRPSLCTVKGAHMASVVKRVHLIILIPFGDSLLCPLRIGSWAAPTAGSIDSAEVTLFTLSRRIETRFIFGKQSPARAAYFARCSPPDFSSPEKRAHQTIGGPGQEQQTAKSGSRPGGIGL